MWQKSTVSVKNFFINATLCVDKTKKMCYYANDTKCGKGGDNMEFSTGQKLRQLRIKANKSLEHVASDLGISYQSMQAYENDTRNPRDQIKIKLANYYNTTVGFIFFDNQ